MCVCSEDNFVRSVKMHSVCPCYCTMYCTCYTTHRLLIIKEINILANEMEEIHLYSHLL